MSISVFDSPLYRDLFGDAEAAKLFADSAEIRAMMLVLGALAKVQGQAGVIPEVAGAAINRAAMDLQIDPAALAAGTGANGVTVPGLVAAFRAQMGAPEHGAYLHWGATSQDIQDTALSLRLRQVLALIDTRLTSALLALADLADRHADTPMAARTYGQIAVPTSFGALVASWGQPVLRLRARLPDLRRHALAVSLSGAAGTASELGPDPNALRTALAQALDLSDPGHSWHATRDRRVELGAWLADVTAAGGKLAEDLLRLTRSDVAEIQLTQSGASSTMPQKQNPVAPSILLALARVTPPQAASLAHPHGEARDGAAWFTEWLVLPPLAAAAARASALMATLAAQITPDTAKMADRLEDPLGLIHAEALSFALAQTMPRPDAQAQIKRLAKTALDTGTALPVLAAQTHPDTPWPDLSPQARLGTAPSEARAFAKAARAQP